MKSARVKILTDLTHIVFTTGNPQTTNLALKHYDQAQLRDEIIVHLSTFKSLNIKVQGKKSNFNKN